MSSNHPKDGEKGAGLDQKQVASRQPMGKSWFFGIGINVYKHISSLKNARKDIEDVQAVLKERYELDESQTLFDEQATRDNIIDHLQFLQAKVGQNDKLIIYYSGHGYLDSRERGYWLPHDAEKQRVATYLRNSAIREFVEDIDARHILLISDSCFSGALLTRNAEMDQLVLAELEKDCSRWVIASGRQQEKVADGKPGTNSPFTASVLQVLRKNQETGLNAVLLFDQVSKLTRFKYDQMPQSAPLIGAGHEGGQYIFWLRSNELYAFETAQQQHTIAAYSHFLRKYPRGHFAKKALSKIVELEEMQAWKKAKSSNHISDYFRYLQRYPGGQYIHEANLEIEKLTNGTDDIEPVPVAPPIKNESKIIISDLFGSTKTDQNLYTDPRDNQTYKTIELNGLRWMAQNLNYDVGEGCWFCDNDPKNEEKYGRLYTLEAAKKACPPGWRLPTDEEWQRLKDFFGDFKHAYAALVEGGSSGFSAQLGGKCKSGSSFDDFEHCGFYWSTPEEGIENVWNYYYFDLHYTAMGWDYGTPAFSLSCRCVQDLTI